MEDGVSRQGGLFLATLLTTAVWLGGCAVSSVAPTPRLLSSPVASAVPVQASTETFSSVEYGLSFVVPEGMKLYTSSDPGPLASQISVTTPWIIVNPDFTEESINVGVSGGFSESAVGDFKKLLDENPNTPLPEYERVSVDLIEVGGQKNKTAVDHVFIMQGNILGKLRQVSFQHRGTGFTFTCATAVGRFEEANRRFFDPLFDSMEFK
jgi:hypothetical protein